MEKKTENIERYCQLLTGAAIVAGVVALLAVGVLMTNYVTGLIVEPGREENITSLKEIIVNQPNNDPLITHLHEKDLEFRRGRFDRIDMSRRAGYLLLAAMVVMIGCIKFSGTIKKQSPMPEGQPDVSAEQIKNAILARRVLFGLAAVFAVAAGFAILRPGIDLEQAEPVGPAYATMEEVNKNWPAFRGPAGDGVSAFANIPMEFDVESGEAILWKSEIPVVGNSSPIVWGDKVFLTGGDEEKREVLCYDAASGDLLWRSEVTVFGAAIELDVMEDTGYAASSPVTDGQRVYAIFVNGHIAAFDFQGNKVWAQGLGVPENMYGYASSLAIYQDTVIVQYDQAMAEDGKSQLIGIDGATGRIKWQMNREVPNSWTSPVVVKIGESYQILTVADPFVIAYDAEDGSEIWSVECLSGDVAPSPIVAGGVVYVVEPDSEIFGITPVEPGSETKAEVIWSVDEGAGDIASPAYDGKRIYLLSGSYLTCIEIEGKKVLWEQDMDEMYLASPSIVGDKVYLVSDKGTFTVLQAGDEFKQVASSKLGEGSYASPAFVDGRMFIRGEKNLFCIGQKE